MEPDFLGILTSDHYEFLSEQAITTGSFYFFYSCVMFLKKKSDKLLCNKTCSGKKIS